MRLRLADRESAITDEFLMHVIMYLHINVLDSPLYSYVVYCWRGSGWVLSNAALCGMQSETKFVPNVGLRFDYKQTTGTPSCSLFLSDRFDSKLSAINGLASPNLVQIYDLDVFQVFAEDKQG